MNLFRAPCAFLLVVVFAVPAKAWGQNAVPGCDENGVGNVLVVQGLNVEADASAGAKWAAGFRRRLEDVLRQKVNDLAFVCELTRVQRDKLDLAGRGDIRRILEQIEELGNRVEAARDELQEAQGQIEAQRLASAPFGETSLFTRTVAAVLTDSQKSSYTQRASRAGKRPVTLESAAALVKAGQMPGNVYRIVWSRDGQRAAFVPATFDGQPVTICRPPDDQVVQTIGENKKPVGFDFSPDENIVALADNSKNAFIINLATGSEMLLATGNSQPAVRFSPDGTMLATGGYGTSAKLWSSATGQLLSDLETGKPEGALTPVFSPDGKILAVGNRNSMTCLFDTATGRRMHVLDKAMSQELAFDPSGRLLAVTYVDATLALWDVETRRLLRSVNAPASELYTLDWSPDGNLLVTAGLNSRVTVWDPRDLSMLNELESPEWVISTRFTPDGTKLLVGGGSKTVQADRRIEVWGVP